MAAWLIFAAYISIRLCRRPIFLRTVTEWHLWHSALDSPSEFWTAVTFVPQFEQNQVTSCHSSLFSDILPSSADSGNFLQLLRVEFPLISEILFPLWLRCISDIFFPAIRTVHRLILTFKYIPAAAATPDHLSASSLFAVFSYLEIKCDRKIKY